MYVDRKNDEVESGLLLHPRGLTALATTFLIFYYVMRWRVQCVVCHLYL
jgi:hypothetical protein